MTLLAPLFLLGLLAIGLPIWLHRLSAENPNKQAFSSLMFLDPGEPRRVLAKNLQYLLLLSMRISVLVLLALAFAGPTCFRAPSIGDSADAALHLIVLDVSGSMAFDGRFDAAQDEARDIISSLDSEDVAQVITVGRTTSILTQQTGDPASLTAAVASAAAGVFRLDFGRLMSALDGVIRAANRPVVMHFVTDAQASGLPSQFADLAPSAALRIDIRSIAEDRFDNWAVEHLAGSALTGELIANVRSYAESQAERSVTLFLDDEIIETSNVTLAPQATASVSFAPLALRAGSNRVRVQIFPNDELSADDSRFIALQRPQPRPVLILSSDLQSADTLFVTAALETLQALVIEAEIVTIDQLDELALDDYHFVIVPDAGTIDVNSAAALDAYVRSGGALWMALGPQSSSLGSLPVTGQAVAPIFLAGGVESIPVGVVDLDHPALRGQNGLRSAQFFRSVSITPDPVDSVLISLESGQPLLLERELGAGRVMVYTSTLNREWNDLVVQPAFVPFVSGLANYLLGSAGFSSEAALGSTLAVRAMGLSGGQIFDAAGDPALGLGGSDDVLLDQIGFYEAVGNGVSQYIAVNFDAQESDLRPMEGAALERWNSLGIESTQTVVAEQAIQAERQAWPIGLWVLALLAVLIVIETWVGNWHLRVQRGISS